MSTAEQVNLFVSDLPGLERVFASRGGKLERIWLEADDSEPLDGIYWARVTKVVPGMQAAFLNLGCEREGFLNKSEVPTKFFPSPQTPLASILKQGQYHLAQIRKPSFEGKQAWLSLNPKLAGFYLIYMPLSQDFGISKKFEGEAEAWKTRLRSWSGGQGGWILRARAATATVARVKQECETLLARWAGCVAQQTGTAGPRIIEPLLGRALLACWHEGMKIFVEGQESFAIARGWCEQRLPEALSQLFLHCGAVPLLETYGLFSQWDELRSERVWLKSGGNLSIRQTEAMLVIDVNTAKSDKGKAGRGLAEQVNQEALMEAARQIRLRELSGIIAIDLVDAAQLPMRMALDRIAQKAFGEDEAKIRLLPINEFGVLMLTRERRQLDLNRRFFEKCPRCKGQGHVRARQSQVLAIQEQLLREGSDASQDKLVLRCEPGLAAFLLARRAELLDSLVRRFDLKLQILAHSQLQAAWDLQPDDEVRDVPQPL